MGFIHDIRIVYNPLQIDMKTPVIYFLYIKKTIMIQNTENQLIMNY